MTDKIKQLTEDGKFFQALAEAEKQIEHKDLQYSLLKQKRDADLGIIAEMKRRIEELEAENKELRTIYDNEEVGWWESNQDQRFLKYRQMRLNCEQLEAELRESEKMHVHYKDAYKIQQKLNIKLREQLREKDGLLNDIRDGSQYGTAAQYRAKQILEKYETDKD